MTIHAKGARNGPRTRSLLLGSAAVALGVAAAAVAAAPAKAQPASGATLGEIVVTARRREENLQNTPVAITALSPAVLERRNIVNLEQVSRAAPNLTIYQTSGGVGAAGLFMRGIGYADTIPGQDASIGVYIDGVIAGRNGMYMMPLVEPERVEVLRGPQGTLFGRNTTGGAILITTHTPTDEFSGMAKASYGTYHRLMFQGRIDTGLIGSTGIKMTAAFQHKQQDGSFNALGVPRDRDPGAQNGDAYWFKAVGAWDKLTATFSADYNELKGYHTPLQVIEANAAYRNFLALSSSLYGGPPVTITREPLYTLSNSVHAQNKIWAEGLALTLNYEVNEHLSFKSISSLRAYERHDPSAYGPPDLRGNVGTAAAPRIVSFNASYEFQDRGQGSRQKSQEFQVLGSAGEFEYVGGVYYYKEHAWDSGRFRLPVALGTGATVLDSLTHRAYTVASKSVAAFAQVDYKPSYLEGLDLTGGIRWTKDTRDFAQTTPLVRSAHLPTKNTSFLVSASYRWSPNLLTFVRYSTGYRAGGFNARSAGNLDPIFKPEKLKSLEGGFKLDVLGNRVRLNGAAFINRYNGLQSGLNIPPSSSGAGGNIAVNANARYTGWELEFQAVPVENLTLALSAGHVDPEYKNYPKALETGGLVAAGCTPILNSAGALTLQECASIANFVYFPKTTVDASANYVVPLSLGELSFNIAYTYKSRIQFNVFNLPSTPFQAQVAQKPYGLMSGRIALSKIELGGDKRAQIAVFGDNLTNKKYDVQGIDFGSFATANWGERRTVGVELRADF